MEELKQKIKFKIEEQAHELGSVEAFCWEHDLNKATISDFINDKSDPRLSTIAKICKAVGLKLDVTLIE